MTKNGHLTLDVATDSLIAKLHSNASTANARELSNNLITTNNNNNKVTPPDPESRH